MTSASTTLSTPVLKKAIDRYYKQLQDYKGRADYELAVRTAFLNLLAETAHQVKWMLIPEQTIEGGIRPDGVLRDSFDLKRGFWEAKGPQSDLDKEIAKKTERLFRTIFDNPDFITRNVIAAEIEKVIQALTSRVFNRHESLKSLDRFYVAIEAAAKGIESWSERQHFLNTVYERFFQGYSVKRADTYGIVYTPQEIVDFMCTSVNEVLQREFGTSIAEPGVQIIDPCVGTGSYIVNLLHRIPNHKLKYKYEHDFFCNEIMLLAYYIASLNIEHEYYSRVHEYQPFEGICFTDTLELAESKQMSMFVQENTERIQREKNAQIMGEIGNPPYNVGQKNENDNNKNRRYPVVDAHVYETYVKGSKATNTRALSDAYVKFFRWATDRLQGRDGIVCFVSNNSFVDQFAFDVMRKRLLQQLAQLFNLD